MTMRVMPTRDRPVVRMIVAPGAAAADASAEAAAESAAEADASAEAALASQNAAAASASAAQTAEGNAETAQAAAEAAQTAAEAAQSAAESAQSSAETAATNAQTAETNAETAETNAEAAQVAAENARDAALAAQSAAEAAETNAETAETNAEAAQTAAELARDLAQGYQAAAQNSANEAAASAELVKWEAQGTYSGVTAYEERDVVLDQGSSWVALQDTTGNAPPTLPTTSNAFWQLVAEKGAPGEDGTINSVVPGAGIAVDATDPGNPVVALDSASQVSLGLADSAVQPGDLGTAAFADTGDFATAAQGATADTALQPEDIGVTVQGYDADTAKLDVENQALTGGVTVTSKSLGTQTSGTLTLDLGDRPLQHYTNGGAHTLAPGSVNGAALVDITNNASAGAITTSGWTRVVGDSFTTTNTHKFRCHASVGNGGSLLVVQALQ